VRQVAEHCWNLLKCIKCEIRKLNAPPILTRTLSPNRSTNATNLRCASSRVSSRLIRSLPISTGVGTGKSETAVPGQSLRTGCRSASPKTLSPAPAAAQPSQPHRSSRNALVVQYEADHQRIRHLHRADSQGIADFGHLADDGLSSTIMVVFGQETLSDPLFQQLLASGRPRAVGRLDMRGLSEITQFPMVVGRTEGNIRADSATSDETLIRRLQAHDEIAFADIVERYQAKVFSIIYGILRNHNDAEDIAQQVFSKAYSAIRSFDSRSSLLTWIYRITVNECYDYLRKRRARRVVYESDFSAEEAQCLETAESVVDPAARVDRQLLERDLVVKLLSKVPEQARILMLLREVEGHSMEELADMTGLNENTIKVMLFRTRQKLLQAARRLGKCEKIRSNSGHTAVAQVGASPRTGGR
jgi:RNA polymerase sigma-70 factor (ECF subfamily)